MRYVFLIAIAGLLAFRCQDNTQVGREGDKHKNDELYGHWIWRSTTGSGIAGPYSHSAEELGNIEFLDFTKPNELRIQHIINNEAVNENYTYTVTTADNQYLLTLSSNGQIARKQYFRISNDTLTLSNFEPCCDNAYESVYVLAKDF